MQEQFRTSNEVNELSEIIEKILEQVRTKEERDEISLAIETAWRNIYMLKGVKTEDILKMHMPYRFFRFLEEVMVRDATEKKSDRWGQFLQDLKKRLEAMEVFKIDLAIEPNEELINKVHSWVHRELGGGIVFDIHSDKTILGGIRIVYRGRYINLTLQDQILEVMKREKPKIFEMMGSSSEYTN